MIKSLIFLGGATTGFALASGMTEQQRSAVRAKARRVTKGEHSQRLASAVTSATDSVADAAVSVVETAADKVSHDKVSHDKVSHDKVSMDSGMRMPPMGTS